jgi:hypothetical protein
MGHVPGRRVTRSDQDSEPNGATTSGNPTQVPESLARSATGHEQIPDGCSNQPEWDWPDRFRCIKDS